MFIAEKLLFETHDKKIILATCDHPMSFVVLLSFLFLDEVVERLPEDESSSRVLLVVTDDDCYVVVNYMF